MEFKNYPKRIKLIKEIETFDQLTQEKQKQNTLFNQKKWNGSWRNWKIKICTNKWKKIHF